MSFSSFIFCISVALRGTKGFSDDFPSAFSLSLSSAIFVFVRFQSCLFKVQKVLYVRSVRRDRAGDNMDGRSLTVFAAAAAIGASFYVFLTPDGKKKKGVKRGKCKIVWQSCVAPLSDAASTLMRDNRLTVSFENTSHHHLFSLAFACGFVDFLKMEAIIYYYSFKIFLRFWLIFIPWLILHNQPALTKFRRCLDCNTCIASLMRSIIQTSMIIYCKLSTIVIMQDGCSSVAVLACAQNSKKYRNISQSYIITKYLWYISNY